MKNLILALSLLLTISSSTLAQQVSSSLKIGPTGGPNQTNFRRQNNTLTHFNIEKDYRAAVGVSVKYLFAKLFLKTDILYENKGFKTAYRYYNPDGEESWNGYVNYNYHYLTFPILIGTSISQSGFYVNAGPYLAALLHQNYSYEGPKTNKPTNSGNATSTWKKMDYGFTGGVGYEHTVNSSLQLSVEIRHNEGLRNISQGPIGFKSRSTNLLIGLHYTLSSK